MFRIFYTFIFCFAITTISLASNLKVSNEMLFVEGDDENPTMYGTVDIEWKNAWKNSTNHDAVWIFCKLFPVHNGSQHMPLHATGHEVIWQSPSTDLEIKLEVAEDGTGVFISPSKNYRGDISLKLKLSFDPSPLTRFNPGWSYMRAFGIEMVNIPSGPFYVGEVDSVAARKYSAFYRPDENGEHSGLVFIDSENELEVGKDIFYRPQREVYQGDAQGVVPQDFPKGYRDFYVMKYEIKQGDYVNFLNTLSDGQTQMRSNFGGKNYYKLRGTIAYDGEKYTTAKPDRPCNFLSWDDAMAFADWSALSPMTELEFEKACRGSRKPIANELPWGTADKLKMERRINSEGDLVHLKGKSESEITDRTLGEYGTSPFWVMDLAGSLWERCITIGDSTGRDFKGTHGDGNISYYGFATNEDWPHGVEEKGGFGFRGGGFYDDERSYHEYNPFSPVSYRRYGAWSGGNRAEAYGSRLVRRQ